MINNEHLVRAHLAGIQLSIFELIWPTFRWIIRICLDELDEKSCLFSIQMEGQIASKDMDDCREMMGEILEINLENSGVTWTLAFSIVPVEMNASVKEIMSPEIFKMIAADVAPWRLSAGR